MTHSMRTGLLAAVGCIVVAGYAGETPAWLQKSNQAAQPLLQYITKYVPLNLMAEAIQEEFVPRYSSTPIGTNSHSSAGSVSH